MFLQDTTPDTFAYMIAGYAVFFIVMAIYLVSLVIRWRNLNQDMSLFQDMQEESKRKVSRPKTGKSKTAAKKKK